MRAKSLTSMKNWPSSSIDEPASARNLSFHNGDSSLQPPVHYNIIFQKEKEYKFTNKKEKNNFWEDIQNKKG